MGQFSLEEANKAETASSVPTPEGVPRIVVTPQRTSTFGLDAASVPPPAPSPFSPGQFNKSFGELKPADVTPTQRAKWGVGTGLEYLGAPPSVQQHLGEALVDIPASLTPMGAVLSGADFLYHGGKAVIGQRPWANLGAAGLDALGMLFPQNIRQQFISMLPTAGGRAAREVPQMIPARDPPPWTRFEPSAPMMPQRPYPPQSVAGTPHEQMGWVTPSQVELYGKGQTPFNATAQGPAEWPRGQTPRGSAQQGYDVLAQSPVRFDPLAGHDVASLATRHISDPNIGGFDRYKAPDVHAELQDFATSMAQRGTPVTPMDFELLRRRLRGMSDAPGANTNNRPAGLAAADMLETYQAYPPGHRIVAGTRADIAADRATLTQARGDTRGGLTAGPVEEAIDRAGTRAGVTYSGGNLENATRQNLGAFSTTQAGQNRIPGALPEEREAIWRASQGDWRGNLYRSTGKLLGGGGGMHGYGVMTTPGLVGLGGSLYSGQDPVTALGAGALGLAGGFTAQRLGKAFSRAGAERAVDAAEEAAANIRRHTPEYGARLAAGGPPVEMPSFRDRVTMSLMPGMRETGTDWINQYYTPYENR